MQLVPLGTVPWTTLWGTGIQQLSVSASTSVLAPPPEATGVLPSVFADVPHAPTSTITFNLGALGA